MLELKLHTIDSAPEDSKPTLEAMKKKAGMVPNLYAIMSESPQLLDASQALSKLFGSSSLSAEERHVVWLTVNVLNECHYCIPAHSMLAEKDGVSKETILKLRNDETLDDPKLEALRQFTKAMVLGRGNIKEEVISEFHAQGYNERNALDVVLGVSHKVLTNYTNALASTPVDVAFKKYVDY